MLREKIIRLLKLYDDSPADPYEYLADDILEAVRETVPEKKGVLDIGTEAIGWNKCIEEIESKLK